MRERFRRSAAIPNSPTCAPPTTRSTRSKRQLEGLVAEHALAFSRVRTGFTSFSEAERKNLPPVPQVMVRTIPENAAKSLYIASHIGRMLGMSDAKAARWSTSSSRTRRSANSSTRIDGASHDLVMWDDRCTMHRGTEFDDLR